MTVFVWLIEMPSETTSARWYVGNGPQGPDRKCYGNPWTPDPNDAMRFSSKEGAEGFLRTMGNTNLLNAAIATQHGFMEDENAEEETQGQEA
jgi:hypothetical protein